MAGKPVLFRALQFEGVSALHQSSIYIGKLLVQGAVNTAGLDVITAYTATGKIEGFANSFGDSAAAAVSIFAAQNYGAGNQKRIREGFYTSLKLLFPLALVMALLMALGRRAASGFLMGAGTGAAMDYAGDYLIIISLFYYICYVDNALVGLLRGIGKIHVPVIGSALHISIRVVLSYLLIGTLGLSAVAWATGIGWTVVMGYHIWNYRKYMKKAVDSSEETWYNKNTNCRHIESR